MGSAWRVGSGSNFDPEAAECRPAACLSRADPDSNFLSANSDSFSCPVANRDPNTDTKRDAISNSPTDNDAHALSDTNPEPTTSDELSRHTNIRFTGVPGPGWVGS